MPGAGADGGHVEALDVAEVEALFIAYHPRVYAYVRYRVADIIEAEDLTSEILERALTHVSSYDAHKGAFSTWLFRIAHNTWVNHVKKRQRRSDLVVQLVQAGTRLRAAVERGGAAGKRGSGATPGSHR